LLKQDEVQLKKVKQLEIESIHGFADVDYRTGVGTAAEETTSNRSETPTESEPPYMQPGTGIPISQNLTNKIGSFANRFFKPEGASQGTSSDDDSNQAKEPPPPPPPPSTD